MLDIVLNTGDAVSTRASPLAGKLIFMSAIVSLISKALSKCQVHGTEIKEACPKEAWISAALSAGYLGFPTSQALEGFQVENHLQD